MKTVTEIFGENVFNDAVMKKRLPQSAYNAIKNTTDGESLPLETANVIALEMMKWALEKGVTHFTHWFQPMSGVTAEKHDSFLTLNLAGGCIMNFSGKELIKGEPDASSFPSGGLRSTFEARGYTAWDTSSYAFIKDSVLYIPTAFVAYSGEVLDRKTPLLRSVKSLNKQVKRFLNIFQINAKNITINVGAEQEYFIIDKNLYNKRLDLMLTGRTIFGAKPPKGQELGDHYFGNIRTKVLNFMTELDYELWRLGIPAKTRHNESAPAQHELAPIFENVTIATDHNQLVMEVMKKVAEKHSLVCLLHEKPFKSVNGSGKHNNWSLSADGINILDPGKTPESNYMFLLFLTSVLKAVDNFQDLLRLSSATAGNDKRLGAHEAPPAIISVFLGDEITSILETLSCGAPKRKAHDVTMKLGSESIPDFKQDANDRNRTSPFAFTGSKFEFRMPGSNMSISCPNIIINSMVADALSDTCDLIESSQNKENAIIEAIKNLYKSHKRIVFNGNNYSPEWQTEAAKRGLLNLKNTPQALSRYTDEKNVAMFLRQEVYTKKELHARQDILLENYCKITNIEADTMLNMAHKLIIPAVHKYISSLALPLSNGLNLVKAANTSRIALINELSSYADKAYDACGILEKIAVDAKSIPFAKDRAFYYAEKVIPQMQEIRSLCDHLETKTAKEFWPFPVYEDLIYD